MLVEKLPHFLACLSVSSISLRHEDEGQPAIFISAFAYDVLLLCKSKVRFVFCFL